ncbi:MAG: nucleoside kinase [Sphaerochaetaceae bacterium]|nr:nucleoside kinase [Sphaerochaetaceae bacterium]
MKSFEKTKTIRLFHNGNTYEVASGITVQECLETCFGIDTSHLEYKDNPIVAVRADNELLPFSARLKTDVTIELQRLFSDLGKRMYRHTMCYLLALASHHLFPERNLVIGHSLGDGYYYTYDQIYGLDPKDVKALDECMRTLIKQDIPIEREVLSYRAALEYFSREGFTATATLLEYRNDPTITLYRCDDFLDISYEPLLHSTALISLWDLRPYGDRGMLLRYPHAKTPLTLDMFKDNPLLFSVFREYKIWGNILKVDCLGAMNQICGSKDIKTFIRMNEDLQHRKISDIADMVVRKATVKVVFIAGPSSSGKTTFSKRLAIQLRLLGYDPVQISLDNYYRPKSEAPRDVDGKADLEALEALDLQLFRENLEDLYTGKTVALPRFDFRDNGKRYYTGETISLKEQTILVIEGIHGLNPSLIPGIDRKTTFNIYISALTQLNLDDHNRISTTDNRIIRRIVRDNRTRSTSAETTLLMWPSVERGESLHIFPYQNQADVMINSALEYELAVLKPYAEPLLKTVKPASHDAYPTARRLLTFLENVYPIPADLVPSDSLLREFIGQSEFNAT